MRVSVPAKFLHYFQYIIIVVIKLLVWSLDYWRGNIELLGGHSTDCLFWTVHTKHTHTKNENKKKKKKESSALKTRPC